MQPSLYRTSVALFISCSVLANSVFATCGGGGGGGRGGVVPAGPGGAEEVYRVAWKLIPSGAKLPGPGEASLVVLWFPTSAQAARASDLLTSRTLSLAGARCVVAALITTDNQPVHATHGVKPGEETVVLIDGDGTELGREIAGARGTVNLAAAEKLLNNEIKSREKSLNELAKAAEKKARSDKAGAIADWQKVWEERCLAPSIGKRAARALAKLGVAVEQAALEWLGPENLPDPDIAGEHAEVETVLRAGLAAEVAGDYLTAERHYALAAQIDPADPTALRFLAELYRHQTGEWDRARELFARILAQPADPIAEAVAWHGLGKMTIHGGHNEEGLAMFERSLAVFELPITFRNLAVYWFSEQATDKATGYMQRALALDPDDTYNQIFAAVYLAASGRTEEAARIAREHEDVLEASYNLAAIWAQVGDRAKAMELLRRHFYEYEQYDAVRTKEMEEARSDFVFVALKDDPAFLELTRLAQRHVM